MAEDRYIPPCPEPRLDPPDPEEPCPRCDGEGCPLCEPDPGARADWQYDYVRDDLAYDAWRESH